MSLFSLLNRSRLQSKTEAIFKDALINELENLTARVSAWALIQHSEDGSHNTRTTVGLDFVPVGGMIRWQLSIPPVGWLNCDGSAVSRAAFPKLFTTIGISAGAGDGVSTFNLPNVANFVILAA